MDENLVAAYDMLESYCEFLLINLTYIRKYKDCPNDINEAVSTLIYASARLGDLPELLPIRKLFAQRYGQRFARVALELLPGNLVNTQIKECLSTKCVTDEVKCRLVEEISRSCFQQGPLLLGYTSEWQKQEKRANEKPQIFKSSAEDFDEKDEQSKWCRASLGKMNQEMVDEIAEFESNNGTIDQRLFLFKSPCLLTFIVYNKCNVDENEEEKKFISKAAALSISEDQKEIKCGENGKRKQNGPPPPPYLRAAGVSMPPERPNEESLLDSIARSISFPDHVHPKLPDYDEISAKFMALKREKIRNI
ncbi:unnamed protein product [Cuscuta epithymum]|uniref:Vacuolar protein sorting-associated protein Ist1 n=2 Tax=Cuscuta epithymum TaxID=186058 RepID=A0AAV0DGR3_9ASTE|nr:unnamed protein product [Cuscuta epithymum]